MSPKKHANESSKRPLKGAVLLLEPNEDHAGLAQDMIATHFPQITLTHVQSHTDAITWLHNHRSHMVIAAFENVDDQNQHIPALCQASSGTPLLIISSDTCTEATTTALQLGATHYVRKDHKALTRLPQLMRKHWQSTSPRRSTPSVGAQRVENLHGLCQQLVHLAEQQLHEHPKSAARTLKPVVEQLESLIHNLETPDSN